LSQDLAVLFQVQQADTEICRLQATLNSLDAGATLEAEVGAAQAELDALLARRHKTEEESLDCDLQLKALEDKRKRFSDQLYGGAVHNPRQLADLQGEVEMLGREIGKVEDRVLELMEALDQQRSEIRQRQERLAEMSEQLRAIQERFQLTSGRVRDEIGRLEQRRRELAAELPPPLLKRYEQIRARPGNLGLVKVSGPTCSGCQIALPSETLKALKAGRDVLTCENCGRLLYWEMSAA